MYIYIYIYIYMYTMLHGIISLSYYIIYSSDRRDAAQPEGPGDVGEVLESRRPLRRDVA